MTPQTILDFWFSPDIEKKWYFAGPDFDQQLRDQFGQVLEQATKGQLEAWREFAEGRLALVLLTDQMSRNIFRDQGQAFATDAYALEVAQQALRNGDDLVLKATKPDAWRSFLYMPFMHAEDLEAQRRCLDLFLTHGPAGNIRFARDHLDVIYRFGRFPGRNEALGRLSTTEEIAFLNAGGGGWGKKIGSKTKYKPNRYGIAHTNFAVSVRQVGQILDCPLGQGLGGS